MPDLASRVRNLFTELRRRRVFRVTLGYLVVCWMVIEASDLIMPELNLPDWAPRLVLALAILGLVPTIFLAWVFDITPEGVRRSDPLTPPGTADPAPTPGAAAAPTAPLANGALRRVTSLPRPLRMRRYSALEREAAPATATGEPAEAVPGEAPGLDPERLERAVLAHHRHELRTPVNAILGYSEMLLEDLGADPPAELLENLRAIRESGRQILEGIDELLRANGAGTGEEARAVVEDRLRRPVQRVARAAEQARSLAAATEHDELIPDVERIGEAARQLERLLVALPDGAASPAAEALSFSAMAEEALRRIQPAAGSADQGELPSETVLVVDDSEMNRSLVARLLAQRGYVVAQAVDGEEGLRRLEERSYDLVLLDIMMPGINGIEVLRRLRLQPALQAVPVIMMSALGEMDSVLRCIEMGAQDYLVKPLDPVLLRTRIEASLRVRRTHLREQEALEGLRAEQALVDRLARGLFPEAVAERFLAGDADIAESHPDAAVLVVELDGLARLDGSGDAAAAAARRGELRTWLDEVVRRIGIVAGRWVNGAYWVVLGDTDPQEGRAALAAEAGRALIEAADSFGTAAGVPLRARAGLHTGMISAGVVGSEQPVYEVWGEGVETARGLAALAPPGALLVSVAAQGRLRHAFEMETRGVVEVPGAGQMRVYVVRGPVLEPR